ncbi:hypothetical protein [Novosphingobium sp. PC22D]|uniref:hypothetical protein n=1 Tax=Novosphingobium sp. PC22D TaxID=1962403 RepID=UPI00197F831F|nr:hypothetical protein [Novosphingobium sp. PC22D]
MKRHTLIALACGLAAASPVLASPAPPPVPGGRLGTLVQGRYVCESPGDATGPAGIALEDLEFLVVNGSGYRVPAGRGSYLLTGDDVIMTGGPLQGLRLHRISSGFLRRIEADGEDGEVRCVLSVRTVANAPYLTSPASEDDEADQREAAEASPSR